jgi:hypothetical protein
MTHQLRQPLATADKEWRLFLAGGLAADDVPPKPVGFISDESWVQLFRLSQVCGWGWGERRRLMAGCLRR